MGVILVTAAFVSIIGLLAVSFPHDKHRRALEAELGDRLVVRSLLREGSVAQIEALSDQGRDHYKLTKKYEFYGKLLFGLAGIVGVLAFFLL